MKSLVLVAIVSCMLACTRNPDNDPANQEELLKDGEITLKANFVLNNKSLLQFIDSYIDRCRRDIELDSFDIENNFYLLYIYQNDLFTRVKLSFISPTNELLSRYCPSGTGYFEYDRKVFILMTGLDRLCYRDSTLVKELQTRYKDRIANFEKIKSQFYEHTIQPYTWEADILWQDSIFKITGTSNPMKLPPADTSELYTYIRSIKSYWHW